MHRPTIQTTGSIPSIVSNTLGLYLGNLVYYYQTLFKEAKNLELPYHNLGHIGNVLFLCHDACMYYLDQRVGKNFLLNERQMRNLLIAAIFHDFDHTGEGNDDWKNIRFAIAALNQYILPKDAPYFEEIADLIRATKYPYDDTAEELSLSAKILRDADKCQALSVSWLQQVIIGFSREWKKPRLDVFKAQLSFFGSLKFSTDWAMNKFPPQAIQAKINEAKEHLELLTMDTSAELAAA